MTTEREMASRHSKSWTGVSVRSELLTSGIPEENIVEKETESGVSFDKLFEVGTARSATEGKHGIYVYVDGDESTEARYFIGLAAVIRGESYTYSQLRSRGN